MATVAVVPLTLPDRICEVPVKSQPSQILPVLRDIIILRPEIQVPFAAVGELFGRLQADPALADRLNQTYPTRGLFKNAAATNHATDQKLTIDLSPSRISHIPADILTALNDHGLTRIIDFFESATRTFLPLILGALSTTVGVDFGAIHKSRNINFRLCDYTPDTASPSSENGCGAHRDYGTFSIIFQDGTQGLEIEDPVHPGVWQPVSADATVILCGWCAHIVSGGELTAVRHRVRRQPGVRRLSAVLFVAPDLDVVLKPMTAKKPAVNFSDKILVGSIQVKWFKEVMGKRWRWREGNEEMEDGDQATQDEDIEKLILRQ